MDILSYFSIIIGLVILAEATYLVVTSPHRMARSTGKNSRSIFVDTSVLIDGRILAIAKTGFITDTLVIPRSVVGELQFLADHADHEKRERARHGLDVVKQLQDIPQVKVQLFQDGSKAEEGVDERLLSLAKKHHGIVCTIDYNLNKVATVENIAVFNINELAQSLRMAYLPGERMRLEVTQKGQDEHQAVGYLPDGTMVVVEKAYKLIGKTVEIEFIRSLQTAAGRMMFAKLVGNDVVDVSVKQRKPVGKKPIAQKVIKKEKAVSGRQKKQAVVTSKEEVVTPQDLPGVYHSDPKEQRKAKKPPMKRISQKDRSLEASSQRQKAKRPKTSAQREASFINLVESQSEES